MWQYAFTVLLPELNSSMIHYLLHSYQVFLDQANDRRRKLNSYKLMQLGSRHKLDLLGSEFVNYPSGPNYTDPKD